MHEGENYKENFIRYRSINFTKENFEGPLSEKENSSKYTKCLYDSQLHTIMKCGLSESRLWEQHDSFKGIFWKRI